MKKHDIVESPSGSKETYMVVATFVNEDNKDDKLALITGVNSHGAIFTQFIHQEALKVVILKKEQDN